MQPGDVSGDGRPAAGSLLGPLLGKAAAVALLGLLIVQLPRLWGGGGQAPPTVVLLSTGLLLTLVTAAALLVGLRSRLGLPAQVAAYAVAYNALIVFVKFVFAPRGVYEVNRTVPIESLVPFTTGIGAIAAAISVFCLYLAAFGLLYLLFRRRIASLQAESRVWRPRRTPSLKVVVPVGLVFLFVTGSPVLLLLAVVVFGSAQYLEFVFSSGLSLLIGIALAGAAALAAAAFQSAAERAQVVRDAALLTAFFWFGVALLAVYHVLWVVYILVLATVWPLRVVIPK
jgi:hypothetical protein